ncbi:MAG: hypothetical protein H6935_00095 [Thiobacillus sp.]|nr:hypothetical protein [Thiobacillus sp.]
MPRTAPFEAHHGRYEAWFEVERLLHEADFIVEAWGQTLAHPLPETREIEAPRPGRGQCAFVVVAARKPEDGLA